MRGTADPLLAQVADLGSKVRTQNPDLEQTAGENPRWFIRPYVEKIDKHGNLGRRQQRIYLGYVATTPKKKALQARTEALEVINDAQYVAQAQLPFEAVLDEYERNHVKLGELSASTQMKYESLLKNHIRPAFADRKMAEMTPLLLQQWLRTKEADGMSWHARSDLKNLISGIFQQAIRFGFWRDANPATVVQIGRKKEVREKRMLTEEQTSALLAELDPDVRLIVEISLFCTLRISEVLGLQWQHVDFTRGVLMVRQRYWRGDVDQAKSAAGSRDVPMGSYLAEGLRGRHPGSGHEADWVCSVPTYKGRRLTRDDNAIRRYFLRPAAERLGIYYPGFGFHAFRREAITRLGQVMGPMQVAKLAGHSRVNMSLHYTFSDQGVARAAVETVQKRFAPLPTASRTQETRSVDRLSEIVARLARLPEHRLLQLLEDLNQLPDEEMNDLQA